ncbi:glycosyltransferase family 4 protein [Paenisporosarcina sp. TG20]|uniref:glycosyltransferase family 4 protein n=1 Tax=Paenisporosarcina sp. TG20 TaxID=1211706 RepID=UPI0002F367BD|nr:glycosyltransferase family 4 protein [Paenisporosarcina sp. TG20]
MKILFVASVYKHLIAFHVPYMKYLENKGYEIICVAKNDVEDKRKLEDMGFKCFNVSFDRNPWSLNNIRAYRILIKYFKENSIKFIHVHTPVAAFITRLAARKQKFGVVYTAHGFHFFKGAPIKNWIVYFTLEKLAAKWTSHIITMNMEDYNRALKMNYREGAVHYVHGVGVQESEKKLSKKEKKVLLKEIGIPGNSIVISYVAEFNENKNHIFLLENWREIKAENSKAVLLLMGSGTGEKKLEKYIQDNDLKDIYFLGYRQDIDKLLQITNVVTLLSYREGLPKSIMEAMREGLPCIVSDTRGLRDLVNDQESGYVVSHNDDDMLIQRFNYLLENKDIREKFGINACKKLTPYILGNVLEEYKVIYKELLGEN